MRGEEIAYAEYGTNEVKFVNVDRYPSGEPMVKHNGYPSSVLLRPRTAEGFLGGIFWVQSLIEQGVHPPELICPMVFGSRQDRINPTGDTLFTIKGVAKLINSLGCPIVRVLDPHSDVTPALIDRCVAISAADILTAQLLSETSNFKMDPYDAVVAPDAGAEKRAGKVAQKLGVPLIHGWKTRDVKDGKLTGFGIESAWDISIEVGPDREPHVLVVDDICDGGGTFIGLADALDAEGLTADLYVTHGLFTKGTQDLLKRYKKLYCTDSAVAQRPDVQVIDACDYLLRRGHIS